MFQQKKILSIIPARGGSKGIPLKNLRTLQNKSLVRHAIEACQETKIIDRIVVSTDHQLIADEANRSGIEVPFFRPEKLSGDRIGDFDVLEHGLFEAERHWQTQFDIILMIQPTSPLRKTSDIIECITQLSTGRYDAVWTISEVDLKYHPLKQLTFQSDQLKLFSSDGRNIVARQQLIPTYYRNGSCYAFTRETLLQQKTILPERTFGVVLERPLVSIDTEEDLLVVEAIMKKSKSLE